MPFGPMRRVVPAATVAAVLLCVTYSSADAQLGGLVKKAKNKAGEVAGKPAPTQAQEQGGGVEFTEANIDAFIRGMKARSSEMQHITEVRQLAQKQPAMMRLDSLQQCYGPMPTAEANPTMDKVVARAQGRSQPATAESYEQAAGMSMEELQKLAEAAQKGDTAAKRKMMAVAMKMGGTNSAGGTVVSDEESKKIAAVQKKNDAAMTSYQRRRQRCDTDVPPESFFAKRVNAAKAEAREFGESGGEGEQNRINAVINSAIQPQLTLRQFEQLYERYHGLYPWLQGQEELSTDGGWSQEEIAALRAKKAELRQLFGPKQD
jgi:hypothetical protein